MVRTSSEYTLQSGNGNGTNREGVQEIEGEKKQYLLHEKPQSAALFVTPTALKGNKTPDIEQQFQ